MNTPLTPASSPRAESDESSLSQRTNRRTSSEPVSVSVSIGQVPIMAIPQPTLAGSPFDRASSDELICARFWSHVARGAAETCWRWTASCIGRGHKTSPAHSQHGQFTFRLPGEPQRHVYAHRFVWRITRGAIPEGMQVLHRCDCPPCVNPAHLFLGTQADNMKDAAQKNRLTVPRTRTLSLYDRLKIHQVPAYRGVCVELARQYGVTKACISIIRRGRFIGSGRWQGTKAPEIRVRRTA